MSDIVRIPIDRPLPDLRHVEARLVTLGFHTLGVTDGQILVLADRLFCLCCGKPVSLEQFLFSQLCGCCDTGRCQELPFHCYFHDHNLIGKFLTEARA